MARQKDINDVTDEISLIMREVVEANEANLITEIGNTLQKHTDSAKSVIDWRNRQVGETKQLTQRLRVLANQGEQLLINVAKNIGTYAGINTAQIEQEIKNGTKIVLLSATEQANYKVRQVYQLNKFNTSAQFIPNLRESIIAQTQDGIEKGLPVTYKSGRKIGYREYMEMAVRTGIQQEIGQQQLEIAQQASIVFFLCDEYADCADDHAEYQGKVYYNADFKDFINLTDDAKVMIDNAIKAKGFLSVQEVREGDPYLTTRPNCRHRFIPISIDEAIGEDLGRVKTSVDSVRGNYRPENYQDLQSQRSYERNIRKAKKKLDFLEQSKKGLTQQEQAFIDTKILQEKAKIFRGQKALRDLLQRNPTLSRERRRETRKILIKDLGVKYNLNKGTNGQTPPVTSNPPPTPPPAQMNEVVVKHYAMPEEKKVYVKKSYEVDWKKPIFVKNKKATDLFDEWQDAITKVNANVVEVMDEQTGEVTLVEDESRKIASYFHKTLELNNSDTLRFTTDEGAGYWNGRENKLSTHSIYEKDGVTKKSGVDLARAITTNTHELGHAIDYSIADKFAIKLFGFGRGGISYQGTTMFVLNNWRRKVFRAGLSSSQNNFLGIGDADELPQIVKDELLEYYKRAGATQEQIEMADLSIQYNEAIRQQEFVKVGGRANTKKLKEDGEKLQETNAYKVYKQDSKENQQQRDLISQQVLGDFNERRDKVRDAYDVIEIKLRSLRRDADNARFDFPNDPSVAARLNKEVLAIEQSEEWTNIKNSMEEFRKERVKLQAEVNNRMASIEYEHNLKVKAYANLSDFWDALSGGRFYEKPELAGYVVLSGHGQEYFRDKDKRNVEIFTHLQVINLHYPKLYQAMKKDYPEILIAHEKIMALAQKKFAETSGQASFFPKEIKKAME
jgi:hypothetical protein